MKKTLSVSAIEIGTVIDHIASGEAIGMIHWLKLGKYSGQVTIGLNLKSDSETGLKDLIKIEGHHLNEQEYQYVGLFAPRATINLIENFSVIKKITARTPSTISGLFPCANANCITTKEVMTTRFTLLPHSLDRQLRCDYCEKVFSHQQIRGSVP